MTKMLATAAGLALAAGALANPHISQNLDGTSSGSFSARGMTNTILNVDISGTESRFALSDAGNVVLEIDLAAALGLGAGSQVTMTSIGWDLNLTTFGGSWLSEAALYFDDNIAPDLSGLFLTPGVGNSFGGTNVNFSNPQVDLSDNAIPNVVLPNGILRLEFFETFVDDAFGADAIWDAGSTLFVGVAEVPAPGAAAVLGLAGLAGLRRRR